MTASSVAASKDCATRPAKKRDALGGATQPAKKHKTAVTKAYPTTSKPIYRDHRDPLWYEGSNRGAPWSTDKKKSRNINRDFRSFVVRNMRRLNPTAKGKWTFKPVTLVEVCCHQQSNFAKSVIKNHGAAVRVTWPPPFAERGHGFKGLQDFRLHPKPSRRIQQMFIDHWSYYNPTVGPQTTRKRLWYLNIDWPVHRTFLQKRIMQVTPAPSTTRAVLMTSPECRMFSSTQRINVAKGFYSLSDYHIAVQRIRFMRRLHASWRRAAREDQLPRISIHEQPPGARMDVPLKKKKCSCLAMGRWPQRPTCHC